MFGRVNLILAHVQQNESMPSTGYLCCKGFQYCVLGRAVRTN